MFHIIYGISHSYIFQRFPVLCRCSAKQLFKSGIKRFKIRETGIIRDIQDLFICSIKFSYGFPQSSSRQKFVKIDAYTGTEHLRKITAVIAEMFRYTVQRKFFLIVFLYVSENL